MKNELLIELKDPKKKKKWHRHCMFSAQQVFGAIAEELGN